MTPLKRTQRRVRRAARLMDRHCPSWYQVVDLRTLNLATSRDCVLGQTYGHRLPPSLALRIVLGRHGRGFGFVGDARGWRLRYAWEGEIRRRRRVDRLRDRLTNSNADAARQGPTDYTVTLQ